MNRLQTPPPQTDSLTLSFPDPRVLLITMSRPDQLNTINSETAGEMGHVLEWLDREPSLTVAVMTGSGRAFSAGVDLKAWQASIHAGSSAEAAVNGFAIGAGCAIVINCDLVVASEAAWFAIPEAKLGTSPVGACLPRLIRLVGLQRVSEMALTGRNISAGEAHHWGLVNKVVPEGESVVQEALR